MDTFVIYLSAVPDVIWAAIIASILTFTGVLLTNRHYAKQQRAQLTHEKSENEAERKHELRQDVYLAAVEELTLAQQHLMKLSTIDLTKNNPADELTGFMVASTKACLVASDETAKLINELLANYSQVFFSLLAKASPIQEVRTDRDIQNDAHEKYSKESSRILASMTQFNEEAKADSEVWGALSKNLEFSMKQADAAAEARSAAWDELNRQTKDFSLKAYSELEPLGDMIIPAIVAMRKELGIPSDIEAYRAEFQARYAQMKEQLEKFLAEVSSEAP